MTWATRLTFDLCFLASLGLASFVYRKNPKATLNRYFTVAALSLFAWLFTLYLYDGQSISDPTLTLLGRLNFTAVLFVALMGYLFITELINRRPSSRQLGLLLTETILLAALTLGTSAVDQSERLSSVGHVTNFGPLYSLFVIHVIGYLGWAVVVAIRAARHTRERLRHQLSTIGFGMFVSAAIGIWVDIVLPFGFHDFRHQDWGAFAAVLYFASVAYSITAQHLFDVRLVIRRTFVLTGLVTLGLEIYQLALDSLARFIPAGNPVDQHLIATGVVLLLNAFTQDAVRSWLNRLFDRATRRLRDSRALSRA